MLILCDSGSWRRGYRTPFYVDCVVVLSRGGLCWLSGFQVPVVVWLQPRSLKGVIVSGSSGDSSGFGFLPYALSLLTAGSITLLSHWLLHLREQYRDRINEQRANDLLLSRVQFLLERFQLRFSERTQKFHIDIDVNYLGSSVHADLEISDTVLTGAISLHYRRIRVAFDIAVENSRALSRDEYYDGYFAGRMYGEIVDAFKEIVTTTKTVLRAIGKSKSGGSELFTRVTELNDILHSRLEQLA